MKHMILLFLLGCYTSVLGIQLLDYKMGEGYDNRTFPFHALPYVRNEDDVLMDHKKIERYNLEMREKTDKIYDINHIVYLSKEDILNAINAYNIPALPKYHGNREITEEEVKEILENRNLARLTDKHHLQKALTVNRSNLKSFPTEIPFYHHRNDSNFDFLQECELHINTPLLILHESKDKLWYFVMSPIYMGWIKKEDMVLVEDRDWLFFQEPSMFGIITAPQLKIDNHLLDMSVKLPYLATLEDCYQLVLPGKDENGKLIRKEIVVSMEDAHLGYLPYTFENVLLQAFLYEGFDYRWGGMDYSVDCSSYIANVFRTFGFVFPRNTSSQKKSVGTMISLKEKTRKEQEQILDSYPFGLLYRPGHVMLYIGKKDGIYKVIHASGDALKVVVENLSFEGLETFHLLL